MGIGHPNWPISTNFGIWGSPNLGPGAPKQPKFSRKQLLEGFWASDGPKWLDQCGSKLDLVIGHPNWPIWTNLGILGTPNTGPGAQKHPKFSPALSLLQSTVRCCCNIIIFQHLMFHRSRSLPIIWLVFCWFTKSAFCFPLLVWQSQTVHQRTQNCPITPADINCG